VDFSSRKNPTASVGSKPAILSTRDQHANHQTTKAAKFEPSIPATELPQNYASDRTVIENGVLGNFSRFILRIAAYVRTYTLCAGFMVWQVLCVCGNYLVLKHRQCLDCYTR
jgi:hypothetical protein